MGRRETDRTKANCTQYTDRICESVGVKAAIGKSQKAHRGRSKEAE